jgi:hypothetical protein
MSIATDMVVAYLDAERAVLDGKTVSFNGRMLTLENLAEIRDGRSEWERRAAAETASANGNASRALYSVATWNN